MRSLLLVFIWLFSIASFAEGEICGEFYEQGNTGNYLLLLSNEKTKYPLDVETHRILDSDQKELQKIENRKYICVRAKRVAPKALQLIKVTEANAKWPQYPEVVETPVKAWPNGVVPFQFAKDISIADEAMFKKACQEWTKIANITCKYDLDGTEESVVTVHRNFLGLDSCSASTGKDGSQLSDLIVNRILLGSSCWRVPIIIHEIGHILGFVHAHNHIDRDSFINLHWENTGIDRIAHINHAKTRAWTMNYPHYDFMSIMHYPFNRASSEAPPLLTPLDKFKAFQDVVANFDLWEQTGVYFSAGDVHNAQFVYGPPLQGKSAR